MISCFSSVHNSDKLNLPFKGYVKRFSNKKDRRKDKKDRSFARKILFHISHYVYLYRSSVIMQLNGRSMD